MIAANDHTYGQLLPFQSDIAFFKLEGIYSDSIDIAESTGLPAMQAAVHNTLR